MKLIITGLFLTLIGCNSQNTDQERQEAYEKKDLLHKEYNRGAAENYNTYDDN